MVKFGLTVLYLFGLPVNFSAFQFSIFLSFRIRPNGSVRFRSYIGGGGGPSGQGTLLKADTGTEGRNRKAQKWLKCSIYWQSPIFFMATFSPWTGHPTNILVTTLTTPNYLTNEPFIFNSIENYLLSRSEWYNSWLVFGDKQNCTLKKFWYLKKATNVLMGVF